MTGPDTQPGHVDARIISAAMDLVIRLGFRGATMSAVASEAGVSRQTVYTRFGDVDSIIVAALGSNADDSAARTRSVVDTVATFEEKIGVVVSQAMAGAVHTADITELRAGLSADARARLDDHESHFRSLVADIVRFGIETGDVSPSMSVELSADIVLGMLNAAARSAALSGDLIDATATARSMILNALGAHHS